MSDNHLVPQTDDEILNAFADLFSEMVPEDPEEINALLVEAGLDPKQIEEETNSVIKEARSTTPLDWRNRQQEMENAISRHEQAGNDLPLDYQSLLDIWQQLMSQAPARRIYAQARYRNQRPEDLSSEELRSLIQDIRFVLAEGDEGLDTDLEE